MNGCKYFKACSKIEELEKQDLPYIAFRVSVKETCTRCVITRETVIRRYDVLCVKLKDLLLERKHLQAIQVQRDLDKLDVELAETEPFKIEDLPETYVIYGQKGRFHELGIIPFKQSDDR